MDSNVKHLIDGSFYIHFSASKANINNTAGFNVKFPKNDTTSGLLTDSSGNKYKRLIPSGSKTTPSDNAVCYIVNSVKVAGYPLNNRFSSSAVSASTTVNALMYVVQHDSLVNFSLMGGSSKSIDWGRIYIYHGGANGNGSESDIANYESLATSSEVAGGTENDLTISLPCKRGTKFLLVYGDVRYNPTGNTTKKDNGYAEGIMGCRHHLTNCYFSNASDFSGNNAIGFQSVITEFKLKSRIDSIDLGGTSSGGGSSDDPGEGGEGNDPMGDDTLGPKTVISKGAHEFNSTTTVTDSINGTTYYYKVEFVSNKYIITIPSVRATQICIDLCCSGITSTKMGMYINNDLIAYSQNYPINVSGFQMFIPIEPSMANSAGNIIIEIRNATNKIEHANIIVFRS